MTGRLSSCHFNMQSMRQVQMPTGPFKTHQPYLLIMQLRMHEQLLHMERHVIISARYFAGVQVQAISSSSAGRQPADVSV